MTDSSAALQGVVFNIALSPNFRADGTCFAATAHGLRVSRDGGETWGVFHSLLSGHVVTSVALSPNYPQDGRILLGLPGGVLITESNGKEWLTALMPREAPQITVVACAPTFASDGIAFATTDGDGVLRSISRGASWDGWNFGLLDLSVLALGVSPAFADDETLLACTSTGLFRSRNGGRAWREVDLGHEITALCVAFSPRFADDATVCVGTEQGQVFRSQDKGQTWHTLAPLPQGYPVNAIGVAGAEPTPFALTDSGIWAWQGEAWQRAGQVAEPVCWTLLPPGDGGEVAALIGTAAGTVERWVWPGGS